VKLPEYSNLLESLYFMTGENTEARHGEMKYLAVASMLLDIEAEMRNLRWWDAQPPAIEALNSTLPFCADTLEFYQWVQFVFLPRMHALVEQRMALPAACGIAPMLEESNRVSGRDSTRLLDLFTRFDKLLSS